MTSPAYQPRTAITTNPANSFRNSVQYAAQSKSDYIYDSVGAEFASIVFSVIFKNTQTKVRIYAKNMNGDISAEFKEYIDGLNNFLERSGQLCIILDQKDYLDPTSKDCNFNIRNALKEFEENVEIRLSSSAFKQEVKGIFNNHELHHFVIGDESIFRVEQSNIDRSGIFSFNNPKISQALTQIFDKHFEDLEEVDL
jgi:hypothetical protein